MPKSLWERSGHWEKYQENMFVTENFIRGETTTAAALSDTSAVDYGAGGEGGRGRGGDHEQDRGGEEQQGFQHGSLLNCLCLWRASCS